MKLLLAMMLLVGGVTGATLYVAQQKLEAAYLKLFEDQFETEVNYFSEQQDSRMSGLKEPCEALAKSTEFQNALAKGDNLRLYEIANHQLEDVPLLRVGARPKGAGAEGPACGQGLVVRVLDSRGEILRASEARLGPGQQRVRRKLEQQLAEVQKAMDKLESQQVRFISRGDGRGTNLWEMVATRIVDTNRSETLGALVVGVIYFDTAENSMSQMSKIQSGILLEDKIYSRTIPEGVRAELVKNVTGEIGRAGNPKESFTVTMKEVPQRVFVRRVES